MFTRRRIRQLVASVCAASLAVTSLPSAQAQSSSSSSSSSVPPLSALPTVLSAELSSGSLGYPMFEYSSTMSAEALSSAYALSSVGEESSRSVAASFPEPNAPAGELRGVRHVEDNLYEFDVYSPSMDRVITNEILLPSGGLDNTTPRPTFYLMMGADGAADGRSWHETTNYEEFFATKHVNVVTPKGSISSLQADWYDADPATGVNKWTTYLTRELPPLVDDHFHGTGRDAIAGISMSGGPALDIASIAPERYVAAGSYSGCPSTSGVLGAAYSKAGVQMNGGDPVNMWGLPGNDTWEAHSPVLNLDRLRGIAIFVGVAQGVPGDIDAASFSSRALHPQAFIEAASYICSSHFVDRAQEAGLDVEFYSRATGTHTWGLFEDIMRESWLTTIGPALGVE